MRDGVAPEVRDGLTPLCRRALRELALLRTRTAQHAKSAQTVDAVLSRARVDGGRRAIYRELVRMTSDWQMRYPLVDGQGFLGSIDGDAAASADYTRMRLGLLGAAVLEDDGAEAVGGAQEVRETGAAAVLPARLPNLLVNGSFGVATGAASRIPPHNLREVVEAVVAAIDDPEIDTAGLLRHIAGPDFPTGAIVVGDGLHDAYASGRGSLVVRARAEIESGPAPAIVVSELPFMVGKGGRGGVLAEIRRALRSNKLRGVDAVDDESSESGGLRIVIELARDASPDRVLEELYAHTRLERRFELDLVATVDSEGRGLGLRELVEHYIEHRRDVVARRTGLRSQDHVLDIVKTNLLEIAAVHGDERRTQVLR